MTIVQVNSTRKQVVLFVVVLGVALPLTYYLGMWSDFWQFVGLTVLSIVCWGGLVLVHRANKARFGARMTLDEILCEKDPIRMVQLLRYHLGWSPGKIAAELNAWGSGTTACRGVKTMSGEP